MSIFVTLTFNFKAYPVFGHLPYVRACVCVRASVGHVFA